MNVAAPTRESDKFEQLQRGLSVGRSLVLSRGNLEPVSPVWLGGRSKLLLGYSECDSHSSPVSFKEWQEGSAQSSGRGTTPLETIRHMAI